MSRIRSRCTTRRVTSSVVWPAATTVCRASVRSGAHSACQPPSGRSSTAAAAAACIAAPRLGATQRGPADQHRQHRVLLVRHGGRAAAARSAAPRDSSAISGRARTSTSLAIRPAASVVADQGVADPGQWPRGWCARAVQAAAPGGVAEVIGQRHRPAGGRAGPAPQQLGDAASVPAAPPTWTGSERRTGASSSRTSRTPCSQPAALSPKVVGHRVLGQGAPGRARCPGAGRRGRAAPAPAARSSVLHRAEDVAQLQHQRGVQHVLAGQAAVQPARRPRGGRLASGPQQRAAAGSPGCRRSPRPPRGRRLGVASSSARSCGRQRNGRRDPGSTRRRTRPTRPRTMARTRDRSLIRSPARSSPGQKRSLTPSVARDSSRNTVSSSPCSA